MNEQRRQEHEPDETMQVESEEQEQGKREIEVRKKICRRARRRCMNRSGWKAKKSWSATGWHCCGRRSPPGCRWGRAGGKGIFHARLPDDPSRFFIENLGYTFGFIIVIMARQQLFTENTVTAVLPIMHKPTPRNLLILLRLWGVVLLGNLIGTGLAALAFTHMPLFDAETRGAFISLGEEVMRHTPGEMFANGILAGWIIATMVWIFPGRRRGENLGDRADDLPGGDLRSDPYRGRFGRDPLSGVQRRD